MFSVSTKDSARELEKVLRAVTYLGTQSRTLDSPGEAAPGVPPISASLGFRSAPPRGNACSREAAAPALARPPRAPEPRVPRLAAPCPRVPARSPRSRASAARLAAPCPRAPARSPQRTPLRTLAGSGGWFREGQGEASVRARGARNPAPPSRRPGSSQGAGGRRGRGASRAPLPGLGPVSREMLLSVPSWREEGGNKPSETLPGPLLPGFPPEITARESESEDSITFFHIINIII